MIQAGGGTLHPDIHILMNTIWRMGEVPHHSRNILLYCLFTVRAIKLATVIVERYNCHQRHTKSSVLSRSTLYVDKIIGNQRVDFNVITDQLLIISFASFTYWRERMGVQRVCISYL